MVWLCKTKPVVEYTAYDKVFSQLAGCQLGVSQNLSALSIHISSPCTTRQLAVDGDYVFSKPRST